MAFLLNEHKSNECFDNLTNEENIRKENECVYETLPFSDSDPLDISKIKLEVVDTQKNNSNRSQALNEQKSTDCKKMLHYKIFAYQQDLVKHAAQYHPKEKALKCRDCSVVFSNLSTLSRHARVHLNSFKKDLLEKHICEFCSKTFDCSSRLKYHLAAHTEECPFSCSFCQKRFKYKFSLKKHQRNHCKDEPQFKKHICEFCSKNFENSSRLKYHVATHTEECPFSCSLCEKRFKYKYSLKKHQITHYKEDPKFKKHVCEFCSKPFTCRADLKRHIMVHTEERPFSCPVCKKMYKHKNTLNKHQRTHYEDEETLKKHVCKYCSKRFYDRTDWDRHLRVHTGETPFSCSMCKESFKQKKMLIRHENIVHAYCKEFKCRECALVFSNFKSLTKHRKCHKVLKRKKHLCEFCSKTFHHIGNLKSHYSVHSDERPFSCCFCQKNFKLKRDLKRHKQKFHLQLLKNSAEELESVKNIHQTKDNPSFEIVAQIKLDKTKLNASERLDDSANTIVSHHIDLKCQEDLKIESPTSENHTILKSINDSVDNLFKRNDVTDLHKYYAANKELFVAYPTVHQKELGKNSPLSFRDYTDAMNPIKYLNEDKATETINFKQTYIKKELVSHSDCEENVHIENMEISKTETILTVPEPLEEKFNTNSCRQTTKINGKTNCHRSFKFKIKHSREKKTILKENICIVCNKMFNFQYDLVQHIRKFHRNSKVMKYQNVQTLTYRNRFHKHISEKSEDNLKKQCSGERPCQKAFRQKINSNEHHHLEQKSKDCDKDHSETIEKLESNSTKCEEKYTNLTDFNAVDPLIVTTNNVQFSANSSSATMDDLEKLSFSNQTSLNDYLDEKSKLENTRFNKEDDLDIKNIIEISKTEYIHDETFVTVDEILADISNSQQNQIIMKDNKTESNIKHHDVDKKFTDKHIKRHQNIKQEVCEFCSKTFNCKSRLKYHLKSHSDERVYTCSICQKSFKYKFSLKKHQRTHFVDETLKKHFCEFCSKRFYDRTDFERHLRIHTGETPFACSLCKESFKQKKMLLRHQNMVHFGDETLKKHVCEFCSKRFYDRTDWERHVRVHTGETPFSCSLCKESFKQKKMLIRHQNMVHSNGSKEFKCRDCSLVFSDFKSLTKHRKCHKDLKRKKHLCEFCSKAFHHIGNLKSHYSVHSDERPFSCCFCQKTFKLKHDMKTHQKKFHLQQLKNRTEESENLKNVYQIKDDAQDVFETQSVKKIELDRDNLNASQQLDNNSNVVKEPLVSSDIDLKCKDCGMIFSNMKSLSYHVKTHNKFQCAVCSKTFADIYHWKRHLRVHTEERPYCCSQCEKSFKNNYNLSAHYKTHEKQKSKEDKKNK